MTISSSGILFFFGHSSLDSQLPFPMYLYLFDQIFSFGSKSEEQVNMMRAGLSIHPRWLLADEGALGNNMLRLTTAT